ncbi:MAG: hypothetical protein K2X86_16635 [Cytophagaceae bacterium]|nr:hypothetical protein [Cytophagaceae bacterium]
MKTSVYNPSHIELEFAQVIQQLQEEIQKKLKTIAIVSIEKNLNEDNPRLIFKTEDRDGDQHELVIKFIQRSED